MPSACFAAIGFNASPNMPKACPYAMALSFWKIDTQANQRDGSFGFRCQRHTKRTVPLVCGRLLA